MVSSKRLLLADGMLAQSSSDDLPKKRFSLPPLNQHVEEELMPRLYEVLCRTSGLLMGERCGTRKRYVADVVDDWESEGM